MTRRSLIVCAVLTTSAAMGGASCFDFGALTGPDAGSDGSTSGGDALADVDVINDGGLRDGAATSFCDRNAGHTFCDDFDDPTYLEAWNQPTDLNYDGSLSQDPTTFVSPPYSLESTVLRGDAATYAFAVTKFAVIPSSLRIEFDFSLVSSEHSAVSLANINLPNASSLTLKLASTSPALFEVVEVTRGDAGLVYNTLPSIAYPIELGSWYHVLLTFDLLGADAGEVDLTFNGGAQVVNQIPVPISLVAGNTFTLQAGVGSFSAAPFLGATVNLDNYLVDLK